MQSWLLNSSDNAKCMNPECKREFDREVLLNLVPKKFVNFDYKEHRENALLDIERSMLPSTLPFVEQELGRRENERLLEELRREKIRLRNLLAENHAQTMNINGRVVPPLQNVNSSFVQRCCVEGCRGWLSTAWKCGVCNTYSCPDCHRPKRSRDDEEHVCDPEEVKTVKMLKTDSKKCPACSTWIIKTEGCNQMFCTAPGCNTAFDWKTLRIINSGIHNPHYFEALRRGGIQGRNLADIPCGGVPTPRELQEVMRSLPDDNGFALKVLRLTNHITHVEMPRYPTEPRHDTNLELRIKYMLKEISDAEFRQRLQRREKDMQKKRDFGLIMQMVQNTLGDELRRLVLEKNVEEFKDRAIALIEYANSASKAVCRRYDCRGFRICLQTGRVISAGKSG